MERASDLTLETAERRARVLPARGAMVRHVVRRLHAARRLLDSRYVRDALIAADPGLVRLTLALRAVASGIAAALLLRVFLQLAHQPGTLLIVGVGIGTMSTLWINDPTPRAQALTTALLPLPCVCGLVLGSVCARDAWAGMLGFVAVTFTAVYARRYGPRGNALGMGVFLTFVYALFLGATPRTLPWMIACTLLAIACNFSARFVLLRERPERTRRRLRSAFAACARGLLRRYADALANGDWDAERSGVLVGLTNLNGIALALEGARSSSAADGGDGIARLFVAELGLQRMAASSRRVIAAGLEPAFRATMADCLLRIRSATGAPDALIEIERDLACLEPRAPESVRIVADARELCRVLAGSNTGPGAGARLRAWSMPSVAASAATDPQRILRQALQAALAAGMASAVGRLLSYTRWYWAVLATFVIFSRASSRGDTLIRGAHRLFGTLLGLGAGLALVHLAHARPAIALPLLFTMLFLGIYFLRVSYAVMVGCITCALALLYGVLGRPTAELLHVRLEETAAGVAIGTLVSMCVLPIRTRPLIFARMSEVLRSIHDALTQVARWLDGGSWQEGPIAAARAVDRARQRLREAAAPFAGRIGSLAFPQLTSEMLIVAALVYEMRELLHDCAVCAAPLDPGTRRRLVDLMAERARELEQLQRQLSSAPPPSAAKVGGELAQLQASGDSSGLFARLARLGELMRDLREALAPGASAS